MMAVTHPIAARPALAAAAGTLGALMPKCPLCLVAIISILGIELPRAAAWLTPLTIVFLAISLTLTAIVSHARRRWTPFVVATVAAVTIIAGRVSIRSDHVVRAGAVALIGASVWAGRGGKRCCVCTDCSVAEHDKC